MLFGTTNCRSSDLLTIVVGVHLEEEGWVDLLDVQGDKTAPSSHTLPNVEWFREAWAMVGADLLWDSEDCPTVPGKYLIRGHLEYWERYTPDGDDWDEEFVHDSDLVRLYD